MAGDALLDAREAAAFLEAVDKVRARVTLQLGPSPSVDDAVTFVAHLHRSVDKVMQQAGERGMHVDCAEGCDWCCHVKVEVTPPEVWRIARAICAWPNDAVDALQTRLEERAAALHEDKRKGIRRPCVFLQDKRCSIYAVRPATCRRAHSASVECCARCSADIPQHLDLLMGAEAMMKGTLMAFQQAGLDSSVCELGEAVGRALAGCQVMAENCLQNGLL